MIDIKLFRLNQQVASVADLEKTKSLIQLSFVSK
jgi:hypothetical protein